MANFELPYHRVYPTDMTAEQWHTIRRWLPPSPPIGADRSVDLRRIVDGIFYVSRSGCQWRRLPRTYKNPVLPEGLGVNIHFTDPRQGEMEMLTAAGFRWVRMDFAWNGTEREQGRYDFSAYDRLFAAIQPHGIRALFILDYPNRHFDNDQSPASDEGRAA